MAEDGAGGGSDSGERARGKRRMKLPRMRFGKRKDELSEELRVHLRMAMTDRMERGESEDEARSNAMRELGNVPLIEDVTRAMWAECGWRA
jgi:hypothetical protein